MTEIHGQITKQYVEALEKGIRKACKLLATGHIEQTPCAQFDKTFSYCKFNEDEVCQHIDDPALCWYEYLAGY